MITKRQQRIRNVVLIALFVALIAVGAFVKIPTPLVPISLQLAFVILSGLLLGWKSGAAAVAIYITAGLAGLPIFTAGGGVFYVLKPTFGYMIGFLFGSAFAGLIARGVHNERKPKPLRIIVASVACVATTYVFGVLYMYLLLNFYLGSAITIGKALLSGCVIFLPTDAVWCAVASLVSYRLIPLLQRDGISGLSKQSPAKQTSENTLSDKATQAITDPKKGQI